MAIDQTLTTFQVEANTILRFKKSATVIPDWDFSKAYDTFTTEYKIHVTSDDTEMAHALALQITHLLNTYGDEPNTPILTKAESIACYIGSRPLPADISRWLINDMLLADGTNPSFSAGSRVIFKGFAGPDTFWIHRPDGSKFAVSVFGWSNEVPAPKAPRRRPRR
jgi:hypothetical protein